MRQTPVPGRQKAGDRGWLHGGLVDLRNGTRANLDAIVRNPPLRILRSLHAFYFVLIGAVDLLSVVLAAFYLMGS